MKLSGWGGPGGRLPMWIASAVTLGVLLLSLAMLISACGEGAEIGLTNELVIDEPLGAAAVTDVAIGMGTGKLSIGSGAGGLASGTIRFNVEAWKPTVSRTDKKLTIEQGKQSGLEALGKDVVNDWRLDFGNAPMNLRVSAGAYEGVYDLGGLTLQSLTIKEGAANTRVAFDSANPGQMQRLLYETGASTVSMKGLANANFKSLDFKAGAGSYTLDFSGQLRTDGTVRIKAGAGALTLVVPADTPARVTVEGSMTSVSMEGGWTTTGKTSSTPAAPAGGQQGKGLTITVNMSVGSLKLVTR